MIKGKLIRQCAFNIQLNHVKGLGLCLLCLIIVIIAQPTLYGQEVLRRLTVNPELIKANKNASNTKHLKSAKALPAFDTIPFVDDFSSTSVYPDPNLWLDKKVYINSTFPVNPVTIGVATFDVLDENGYMYKNATSKPFGADTLTSRPFNFDGKNLDNMYFSFFYQAKGLGDKPDAGDSLIVEFYNIDSVKWKKVWPLKPGDIKWPAGGDTINPFKQVMIPVSLEYKKNGFQFRFRNIASIDPSRYAGNHGKVDQWNIDYVKLDAGRSEGDTVLHDIAFVKPLTSLLQTYQSMPWLDYKLGFRFEIKSGIDVTYRNNDTILSPLVYRNLKIAEIKPDGSTGNVNTTPPEGNTIAANTTLTIKTDFSDPFTPDLEDKVMQFDVKAYLGATNDKRHQNDTIHYRQVFSNYFAYDDGSSEYGYGIEGEGAENASLAYQFKTYKTDTITGISIYFNPTEKDTTVNFPFRLAVWAYNDGVPGKLIYSSSANNSTISPKKVMLNQFYNFKLDSGIIVSGSFYIGIIQESDNFLNIGFDLNNDNQRFLFTNVNGVWKGSGVIGSLMMRPVLGNIQTGPVTGTTNIKKNSFSVFPNPASDYVYITTENTNKTLFANLYNLSGKLVLSTVIQDNKLDVSTLTGGLYILKLSSEKDSYQPVKILIQH